MVLQAVARAADGHVEGVVASVLVPTAKVHDIQQPSIFEASRHQQGLAWRELP